jgi:hypothetical protein
VKSPKSLAEVALPSSHGRLSPMIRWWAVEDLNL